VRRICHSLCRSATNPQEIAQFPARSRWSSLCPRTVVRRLVGTLGVGLFVVPIGVTVLMAAATLGGPLPGPLPLFPADNWWNADISAAPLDPNSSAYISFINNGSVRRVHPDFGGDVSPGSVQNYGMPYVVVDGTTPKKSVTFQYSSESDGVNHTTGASFPFYPIPDEAITQPHWVEGGEPGNVDLRSSSDRHLLIVDRDNRHLYELYNVFYDGAQWRAGSGAFFDLVSNARRPDGWTSADAAGLAILPGLVRYDEVFGTGEIRHAFRVTVRATNGYVYPASHRAGSQPGALPMGARLRLKASRDLSGFTPEIQKIFRAMQRYGLIVADKRIGSLRHGYLRHAVEQQRAEPGVSRTERERLRGRAPRHHPAADSRRASESSDRSVASERASEPRERSAPTKRRARERVGESEGRSPSGKIRIERRRQFELRSCPAPVRSTARSPSCPRRCVGSDSRYR
jgi:hypothetical protein